MAVALTMNSESDVAVAAKGLPQLFCGQAARLGDRPCMREKHRGIWRQWTWRQVSDDVRALVAAFLALGVRPSDSIVLIGENRPRLYWAMISVQWLGAVPVPLPADTPTDALSRVLIERRPSVVVLDGAGQYHKILEAAELARTEVSRAIVVSAPFYAPMQLSAGMG
jgi:long-subunit acyl-CoA synthetase (AMP-forming)